MFATGRRTGSSRNTSKKSRLNAMASHETINGGGERAHLYDKIKSPLYLTGDSHLLIQVFQSEFGYTRGVGLEEDVFMSQGDYVKLLEILSTPGRNHDFIWELFYENKSGEEFPIGEIDQGEISPSAMQYMTFVMDRFGLSHQEQGDVERRQKIFSKYFDENDEVIFLED